MVVLNNMSRFQLAAEAVRRAPFISEKAIAFIEYCDNKLKEHKKFIYENLDDMPEIRNWKWDKS